MALADAGKETLAVPSPHFYMAYPDVRRETLAVLSPHFYMAHTDVRKETLAVLSPHFYMAHADVGKEAAVGALSPEARYEHAGVRVVAALPLLHFLIFPHDGVAGSCSRSHIRNRTNVFQLVMCEWKQ